MSSTVSLSLFKKHVRADEFADDDTLLQHYLDTAEESIATYTNRTLDELIAMSNDAKTLPLQLQQAEILLAAHWYNQRESVSNVQLHEVPDTLQALIKPFRKLCDDTTTTSTTTTA